jgi:signal transduction histidine kinase
MQQLVHIILSLCRTARGLIRRREFWRAFSRVMAGLLIASLTVEIPAFWIAKKKDERQALGILENRRFIFSQTFGQFLRLNSKVESAASLVEAEFHMRSILDTGSPTPGVVGMGIISRDAKAGRWTVHRQAASASCPEFQRLLGLPPTVEALDRLQIGRESQLTPLFSMPGSGAEPRPVFCVLLTPLPTTAALHPGGDGVVAQMMVVDIAAWARNIYLPASLRVLRFYLANEPFDGLRVSFNYEGGDLLPKPGGVIRLQVDPDRQDTPSGLLAYLSKVDESRPVIPVGESRFKVARSVLLSFNIAPGTRFRCFAETTPAFFLNSTLFAVVRLLPWVVVGLALVSALVAMLWLLYLDGRQQIQKLAEAQRTIASLHLYQNMVQQELHDHIIQNLTLLGIQVATKGTQDAEGQKTVRDTILRQIDYLRRELRRFLSDGSNRLEDIPDLVAQLEGICRHFETQSKARCRVTSTVSGESTLSPEVLFRACRFTEELIGNAIRHGGATRVEVTVSLEAAASSLQVRVEDDGKGFDPDHHSKGFGLQNMSAFARRSKGSLTLERRPTGGMSIRLSIPVVLGRPSGEVVAQS